jgi:hypothetical protein
VRGPGPGRRVVRRQTARQRSASDDEAGGARRARGRQQHRR